MHIAEHFSTDKEKKEKEGIIFYNNQEIVAISSLQWPKNPFR